MKTPNQSYLGAALALVLAAACGQGPGLIDRTQPNYLRKSELIQGEWYVMDTVVDVPSTNAVTFIGYQGQLDKVRFEITEDMLIAYRTYEFIPGTDPKVDTQKSRLGRTVTIDGKPYRGAPYGAWRIQSHFDRQREYNAATGEQSNVLVENGSDRPWYQRDFMRVDWGKNLISNMTVADANAGHMGHAGSYYIQPIDQEPGEDAVTMDYRTVGDKQELSYFDFTVKQIWDPEKVDYPGYGQIPYCWLNPKVDCESAVIKSRYSFKRVDTERVLDYEPLFYTDKHMTKFGMFRTERVTYDRYRSVTDSGRLLFANRHNIWKKWRNADGSSIPVAQRDPRPIVYHLSAHFPANLMEGARQLEKSWNAAFRRAVAVPKYGVEESADVPNMFILCENPVPAGAPAECGPEGLSPRLGDIRYNILAWVHDLQQAGPLGYGPSGADPETGEIVQAGAYMYGASMDAWAGDAQVVLDVLTGDLSADALMSGKNVRDFISMNYAPTDPRRPAQGPWTSQNPLVVQPAEAQKPGAFNRLAPKMKAMIQPWHEVKQLPLQKQDRRKVVNSIIANNPALESELVDSSEVRAAVLAAAPGEKARMRLMSDPTFYRSVARQTMLRVSELDKLEKARIDRASKANIWLAEFSDDQYYGMAKRMKSVFDAHYGQLQANGKSAVEARAEAKRVVYDQMRNAAFRSVAEHEVGHTLGLMHNFQGSFDALNYKNEYWDYRKETIGVMVNSERVMPLTPKTLVDASKPNQKQIDNSMDEYAYSSIMDYGSRMNADVHGIGKYDMAAILFAYSGTSTPGYVELFRETRANTGGSAAYSDPNSELRTDWVYLDNQNQPVDYNLQVRGAHTEIPYTIVRHYTPVSQYLTDKLHYTTLPFMFAEKTLPFEQALDQGIERMRKREFARWSDMETVYKALDTEYRNFIARNADRTMVNGTTQVQVWDRDEAKRVLTPVLTQTGGRIPVEVPYMFCSDYEVGSNLACNRWDRGADFYEMSEDWLARYKDYYAFTNFKRDRFGWGPNTVVNRNYGRLLSNLPNVYQHWLFNIFWSTFYTFGDNQAVLDDEAGIGDPITQNYWTMAVMDGTNQLLQIMATPSAGYYAKTPDDTAVTPTVYGHWERVTVPNNSMDARLSVEAEAQLKAQLTATAKYTDLVYVPRGPGRSMYTLFEHDGYNFFERPVEVGHFWDQYASMLAITSSETNFLGVDRGSDALRYSLPYYITFPKEISKVYNGLWTGAMDRIGGTITPIGGGLANVTPPTFMNAKDYVLGFDYPEGSAIPTSTQQNQVYPSPTWSTRFYAHLYGMAYFTENFNQDFASQNQVFRLGTGENVTPITGYDVVSFADPFGGGHSYSALKSTTDAPTAAVEMVEKATALKTAWDLAKAASAADPTNAEKKVAVSQAEARVREQVRTLEVSRGLYSIFSQTW